MREVDGSTVARWLRALGSVERKNKRGTASAFFFFCRRALSGLLCQGKGAVSGAKIAGQRGGLSWLVDTVERKVADREGGDGGVSLSALVVSAFS